ncbi:MAG: YbhN family protein [Thermoguttaceae bacterium]|nr:YbhN family protein [Thermoguttaceae bacterium]
MQRFLHLLKIVAVLAVVIAACFFLKKELSHYSFQDFRTSLAGVAWWQIGLAGLLTILNYTILYGYDWIAIHYLGHTVPAKRLVVASLVGQIASLNFGSLLGGAAARFRMYTLLGFRAVEIMELIVILGVTYWLGALSLAATVFLTAPLEIPTKWAPLFTAARGVEALGATLLFAIALYAVLALAHRRHFSIRSRGVWIWLALSGVGGGCFVVARQLPACAHQPLTHIGFLGIVLAAIVGVYFLLAAFYRRPIQLLGHTFQFPPLRVSLMQTAIAAADFVVGATAFFILFPEGAHVPYMEFLGIYLLGQVVSAFTHAPGGLGILELVVLKFVPDGSVALAPVLLFRVIYFWIPLLFAGVLLVITEFWLARRWQSSKIVKVTQAQQG